MATKFRPMLIDQIEPVNSMPVLELDVVKRLGTFELDLTVQIGSGITALVGPSGAGKTTTLECLGGAIRPDRGEIVLNGRTLFSSNRNINCKPEKRHIGVLYQDGALFPHMDVGANIRYGYDLLRQSRRRIDVQNIIEMLDVGHIVHRDVHSLSGGEAQRVALARALAVSPELLLLDEPMASLDQRMRGIVLSYLRRLHEELDIPFLYVSHSISEVLSIADKAIVLKDGRLVSYDRPTRLVLEGYLGGWAIGERLENLVCGEVLQPGIEGNLGVVKVGHVEMATPPTGKQRGDRVVISLGASDVMVSTEPPKGLSARNCIPMVLQELRNVDHRVLAIADIGTELIVELTEGAVHDLGLRVGMSAYLVFKSNSVKVLDTEEVSSRAS